MSHQLSSYRPIPTALVVLLCGLLVACSNDEGDGKTYANTPTGNQTALVDPSQAPAAQLTKEHGNDVLDWLKMTPEKVEKLAEKKPPPEPPKPVEAKPEAKPEAPKPVQLAAAAPVLPTPAPVIERPVLQPVSASARDTLSLPTAPVSAPAAVVSAPVVATAAPLPTPAAAPPVAATLKLVSREQPAFPLEALRKGIRSGFVKARIQVNADGSVKSVEIIEATPSHLFDRAVINAALNWKYAPMAAPATTVTEFDFKGDE